MEKTGCVENHFPQLWSKTMQVKVSGSIFHRRAIKMNPEREKIRSADALAALTLPTLKLFIAVVYDLSARNTHGEALYNVMHRRKLFVGWVVHKPFHNVPDII